jgi:hypothetical protein
MVFHFDELHFHSETWMESYTIIYHNVLVRWHSLRPKKFSRIAWGMYYKNITDS